MGIIDDLFGGFFDLDGDGHTDPGEEFWRSSFSRKWRRRNASNGSSRMTMTNCLGERAPANGLRRPVERIYARLKCTYTTKALETILRRFCGLIDGIGSFPRYMGRLI